MFLDDNMCFDTLHDQCLQSSGALLGNGTTSLRRNEVEQKLLELMHATVGRKEPQNFTIDHVCRQ